jgi:hypothetical protein
MRRLLGGVLLIVLAGCGKSESSVAVTPVMADTKGTYRLVTSRTSVTAPGSASTFNSYSSGILRLEDPGYTRSVSDQGQQFSAGAYRLGTSVNSILTSSQGAFTLTSSEAPFAFTGSYQVAPDFILILNYDQFVQPGNLLVTRSETWIKESDSPRFN